MVARRWSWGLTGVALAALVLSGCATKFEGNGAIPSTVPGNEAKFHFTFDGPKSRFHGQYEDEAAGVRMEGDGVVAFVNNPGQGDNCMNATIDYESKVKLNPGTGQALWVACDNDPTGKKADRSGDLLIVQISSGPFAGYSNHGTLTHGHLEALAPKD